MPNPHKLRLLNGLEQKFGRLEKLGESQSLYALNRDAARVYIRYSKVHPDGRAFFGLRRQDLNELEGHNSFLCFLLDDGSQPLFVPFCDFEEVFRNAEVANDGQYKVLLSSQTGALGLYIAKLGHFNLEGYVGNSMPDHLVPTQSAVAQKLGHPQIQTLLVGVGRMKGYDVYVPPADIDKLDWSLTKRVELRRTVPNGFRNIEAVLSAIDVIWVHAGRDRIGALFEVEHTTSIYSGLLRFNDLLLTEPRLNRFSIVADECRRSVFARQLLRPTFQRSGLAEVTSFMQYSNVNDWHSRLASQKAVTARQG